MKHFSLPLFKYFPENLFMFKLDTKCNVSENVFLYYGQYHYVHNLAITLHSNILIYKLLNI